MWNRLELVSHTPCLSILFQQRQMNYFGFRKIAGKGKMAPCSYVNEAAKEDLSSLLFIKRKKTGVSSAAAKLMAQQNRLHRSMGAAQASVGMGGANQLMASSMMGASALNPALGNASLSLNNFSLMGGLPGMGAGAPATNNFVSVGTQAALNKASLGSSSRTSLPSFSRPTRPP